MFIDDHRVEYGVEAICDVLPIASSTFYHHQAVKRDPTKASLRAQRDGDLGRKIKRCWEASGKRYGAVKVWYDLVAEGEDVARCTVVRLMKEMEIQGVIRGKGKKTTHGDPALPCPEDKVNRDFKAPAPNVLWVADFTYVRTAVGFVYVAFIIDVFARYIVGWQVSSSPNTKLVLDALEQALSARNPDRDRLTHHSDRGVQYLSIKYSERLEEAKIGASVGSVGDSYDNALAETINGLYKAEVIHRKSSWRTRDEVEWATLHWVDWFNNRRLLEPIGNIPPAEAEANYYSQPNESVMSA